MTHSRLADPAKGWHLENIHWMENGVIDILHRLRPAEHGCRGIHNLYRRIMFDHKCPEEIHTPIDIVVREKLR